VLLRHERRLGVVAGVGRIGGIALGVYRDIGSRPKVFEEHVVADGIDKSSEAFRMLQALLAAKCYEHSKKGFLADILYDVRGETTRPQLDKDEISEVRGEVPFDCRFAVG
jgi:hypothetical protein